MEQVCQYLRYQPPLRIWVLLMVLFLTLIGQDPAPVRWRRKSTKYSHKSQTCCYSCRVYPDSKIASRRFPRQWLHMMHNSHILSKSLAALQPALPHWKLMQRPSPVVLVDRHTSHESFSRTHFHQVHTPHCGSRCLWCAFTPSACHPWCQMFERALFVLVLSSSSLSLAPRLALHCVPVLCPAHQLPQCRIRRGLKPLHSHTMRSIAPWRYTILSQVMSPTSSTTSTTQRLLQRSSKMNPSTQTLNRRTRAMRNSTMSLSEKRCLHHCWFRSEKNQRTWDKLITLMRKVCCQLSPFSHTQVRGDPYTNLVRAKNENQVAKWKTKESGFSLKHKSKFSLKSEPRFRNTSFKPILIEEVSRKWMEFSSLRESYHSIASDEQLRRDQQLLHEQLSEQNRDLREAHMKSLHEMEELKRVQGVLAHMRLFSDPFCWDPSGRHPWLTLHAMHMLLDAPRGGDVTGDFVLFGGTSNRRYDWRSLPPLITATTEPSPTFARRLMMRYLPRPVPRPLLHPWLSLWHPRRACDWAESSRTLCTGISSESYSRKTDGSRSLRPCAQAWERKVAIAWRMFVCSSTRPWNFTTSGPSCQGRDGCRNARLTCISRTPLPETETGSRGKDSPTCGMLWHIQCTIFASRQKAPKVNRLLHHCGPATSFWDPGNATGFCVSVSEWRRRWQRILFKSSLRHWLCATAQMCSAPLRTRDIFLCPTPSPTPRTTPCPRPSPTTVTIDLRKELL